MGAFTRQKKPPRRGAQGTLTEEQHVKVQVQIERAAKVLNQRNRAGPSPGFAKSWEKTGCACWPKYGADQGRVPSFTGLANLLISHFSNHLDLHGDAGWQRSHPYRRAGVAPFVTEDFHHQVGKSVYNLGMLSEIGHAVDHA